VGLAACRSCQCSLCCCLPLKAAMMQLESLRHAALGAASTQRLCAALQQRWHAGWCGLDKPKLSFVHCCLWQFTRCVGFGVVAGDCMHEEAPQYRCPHGQWMGWKEWTGGSKEEGQYGWECSKPGLLRECADQPSVWSSNEHANRSIEHTNASR
jgi:hypothetical protein